MIALFDVKNGQCSGRVRGFEGTMVRATLIKVQESHSAELKSSLRASQYNEAVMDMSSAQLAHFRALSDNVATTNQQKH